MDVVDKLCALCQVQTTSDFFKKDGDVSSVDYMSACSEQEDYNVCDLEECKQPPYLVRDSINDTLKCDKDFIKNKRNGCELEKFMLKGKSCLLYVRITHPDLPVAAMRGRILKY